MAGPQEPYGNNVVGHGFSELMLQSLCVLLLQSLPSSADALMIRYYSGSGPVICIFHYHDPVTHASYHNDDKTR